LHRLIAAVVSLAGLVAVLAAEAPGAKAPVRHDIRVGLDPAGGRIEVTDRVTLNAAATREFTLNEQLRIAKADSPVEQLAPGRYRLRTAPANGALALEYAGVIRYALSDQKEEYTRGFRETAGTVGREGVFLSGASGWYPRFGPDLVTFTLDVRAVPGWHLIAAGAGSSGDGSGHARWASSDPLDEITLVGGPLAAFGRQAGQQLLLVYLHGGEDHALAEKYLEASAKYIEGYSRLIAPYPYAKFAVVENFWETGYGMPSFTLLGPQVIRLPFILTTSLPHEILHNWWGNSVFVDYAAGNWCEGLTAYLADHLVQEQQGSGAEYRRSTLQKYRDYVKDGRDFPLAQFRARESAATEAVGYGKSLMVFHMLRRRLGDTRFTDMLRGLYRDFRGRRASWKDVQAVAEASAKSGRGVRGRADAGDSGLPDFFAEWIARAGAPNLRVQDVRLARAGGGYVVRGTLRQTSGGQAAAPYRVDVPVRLQGQDGTGTTQTVELSSAAAPFEFHSPQIPVALYVDPYFDVFRLLDPRETPASIGQIFGESRIVAVLPARAPADVLAAYKSLVAGWRTGSHVIDVQLDSELPELPADRSVWLLGRENRFAARVLAGQPGASLERDDLVLNGQRLGLATTSVVAVARHPVNPEKAVGWIVVNPPTALPAIGRKLPHYGKYSYLAFQGADATNVVSGQWQDVDSPMRIDLRASGQRKTPLPALPADPAKPLVR
jgi:aminopeptidase N